MTGPASPTSVDNKYALELARDIANGIVDIPFPLFQGLRRMPGLQGAEIQLIFADHQGKPALGQSEAERLITHERVHALVGAWNNAVTAAASQVAERTGIPFLNPESFSPGLTRRDFKWFFRTSPNNEQYIRATFDFLRDFEKKRGVKIRTLGLSYEDTAFGTESANLVKTFAKRYQYEVILDSSYNVGGSSLVADIQKLKATNPDVWIPASSYQTDTILLVNAARDLDYRPKMFMAHAAGSFSWELPKVEGTIASASFALDLIGKRPVAKLINEQYKKRAGKDLYDIPANAFTGLIALLEAINRAGSTDPQAIRKALVATSIPGDQLIMPWDSVRFDGTGQNTGVRVLLLQFRGGKYYTVYPFELATKDVLYPFPKWSEGR